MKNSVRILYNIQYILSYLHWGFIFARFGRQTAFQIYCFVFDSLLKTFRYKQNYKGKEKKQKLSIPYLIYHMKTMFLPRTQEPVEVTFAENTSLPLLSDILREMLGGGASSCLAYLTVRQQLNLSLTLRGVQSDLPEVSIFFGPPLEEFRPPPN